MRRSPLMTPSRPSHLLRVPFATLAFGLAAALGACSTGPSVDVLERDAVPDNTPADGADVPGDSVQPGGHTAVTAFAFDPQRTSANRSERALTVAAVMGGAFGRDMAF